MTRGRCGFASPSAWSSSISSSVPVYPGAHKIEHRLFTHITRTWRARPLMTKQDAVAGIAATVTHAGLKCTAVLDESDYPTGQEISGQRMTTAHACTTASR